MTIFTGIQFTTFMTVSSSQIKFCGLGYNSEKQKLIPTNNYNLRGLTYCSLTESNVYDGETISIKIYLQKIVLPYMKRKGMQCHVELKFKWDTYCDFFVASWNIELGRTVTLPYYVPRRNIHMKV